jgi:hypothetical protein
VIDRLVDIRTEDAPLDREPALVDAAAVLVANAAESTARRT